ncbi:DUF4105 domain-containing protein [Myxococcota bacterium]|nr:DUF4105 domain-containing protein [Myxococcota bacterium]
MMTTLLSLLFMLTTPVPADRSEVWVLVVDPGSELFTRFGHSAFWVRGPNRPEEVYDYGHFEFSSSFLWDFLHGNAFYSLESTSLDDFIDGYAHEDREVRAHLLDLSPEQAVAVRILLERVLDSPEHEYRYHHFADNCATRMRDVISQVTYGRWRLILDSMPARPWRSSLFEVLGANTILRHTLSMLLSAKMDRSRTAWDGTYLPVHLERALLSTRGLNPARPDAPFVVRTEILSDGTRHDHVSLLPPWMYAVIAALLALLLMPLVFFRTTIWLQLAYWTVTLVFGGLFFLMAFFHFYFDVCAFNLNLIVFCPWLALFFPFWSGPQVVRRRTLVFLLIAAAGPVIALLLRPFTVQRTSPFPEFALGVYMLLVFEYVLWHLRNRPGPSREAVAEPSNGPAEVAGPEIGEPPAEAAGEASENTPVNGPGNT